MRIALWPDHADVGHAADMAAWTARADTVVLVAERDAAHDTPGEPRASDAPSRLMGFAEVGTRPYADGCTTSPVAYLEGWYVDPDARRQGVGAALVRAAEEWARARGLRELASDVLLDNDVSQRAHEAIGFAEVERVVLYRKSL